MELYHASKEIVQYPEVRKARYTKDFSWGFYCTNNFKQAVRWANRGIGDPIINYYEYKPNEKLNILRFPEISDAWLDFIAECRSGKTHSYDIVEGPMANDYISVCALIEYIARETKNHRGDIVNQIGEDGIKKLLYDAEVDHCLSFEQVSDEVVDYYKIKQGNFDTISACKYSIPSFLDIGKLYSIMIEDCAKPGDEVSELMKIFSSFISDEISNFNTDLYYQNPNYLEWSYREGKLLD